MKNFLANIKQIIITQQPNQIECYIGLSYLAKLEELFFSLGYFGSGSAHYKTGDIKKKGTLIRFYDLEHLGKMFDTLSRDWMEQIVARNKHKNYLFLTETSRDYFYHSSVYFLDNFEVIVLPQSLE